MMRVCHGQQAGLRRNGVNARREAGSIWHPNGRGNDGPRLDAERGQTTHDSAAAGRIETQAIPRAERGQGNVCFLPASAAHREPNRMLLVRPAALGKIERLRHAGLLGFQPDAHPQRRIRGIVAGGADKVRVIACNRDPQTFGRGL